MRSSCAIIQLCVRVTPARRILQSVPRPPRGETCWSCEQFSKEQIPLKKGADMAKDDPRQAAGGITPPSQVLHQPNAGMVSQADAAGSPDERLEQQRRDNINPSLAREQPPDADAPSTDQPSGAPDTPSTAGPEGQRGGWWQKDKSGNESTLDHSNMNPDNLKANDM